MQCVIVLGVFISTFDFPWLRNSSRKQSLPPCCVVGTALGDLEQGARQEREVWTWGVQSLEGMVSGSQTGFLIVSLRNGLWLTSAEKKFIGRL